MSEAAPAIDPATAALLVMDYQRRILDLLPDSAPLLLRARQAIDLVRRHGGQIGFVRVAFEDADYDAAPATGPFARVAASGRDFHADSPTTAIHDDVAPQPGVHEFLTEKIFPRQAEVLTTAQLEGLFAPR
jgi:nicotinamidase-related amidase